MYVIALFYCAFAAFQCAMLYWIDLPVLAMSFVLKFMDVAYLGQYKAKQGKMAAE